jgi:hypothetical protein
MGNVWNCAGCSVCCLNLPQCDQFNSDPVAKWNCRSARLCVIMCGFNSEEINLLLKNTKIISERDSIAQHN